MVYHTPHRYFGEELADCAQNVSQRDGVNPGVVAINNSVQFLLLFFC
jgi:hypothetical protein